MAKVLVKDFTFQTLWIMDLYAAVHPFNNLRVVIGEHLGELQEAMEEIVRKTVRRTDDNCDVLSHDKVLTPPRFGTRPTTIVHT